jgi:hypothetical protein
MQVRAELLDGSAVSGVGCGRRRRHGKVGGAAVPRQVALDLQGIGPARCDRRDQGQAAAQLLDQRPMPVRDEHPARMLRPEDVAELIVYVASLLAHVVINEVMFTSTWNRAYINLVQRAGL